jgi:GTP-binding protein
MIDVSEASGRDPLDDYRVIMDELAGFSADLARKPMIVAATKIDAAQDASRSQRLADFCRERGLAFFAISAVTGAGLDELRYHLGGSVREAREAAMNTP